MNNLTNGQSAAEFLEREKGSEAISKESRLYNYLAETPGTIIKFLFSDFKREYRARGVYCIFTRHNYMVYVGSSNNMQKRFSAHRLNIKAQNNQSHIQFLKSINKHGKEDYLCFLLEKTDDLKVREEYWIRYFDSVNSGYNLTYNTDRNFDKIIERKTRPVVMLDSKGLFVKRFESVSEGANFCGSSTSNVSGCCLGRYNSVKNYIFVYEDDYDSSKLYYIPKINYAKRHTEIWRNNISKKMSNRIVSKETKDKQSKAKGREIIEVYSNKKFHSIQEASNFFNIATSTIRRSADRNSDISLRANHKIILINGTKNLKFNYCKDMVQL